MISLRTARRPACCPSRRHHGRVRRPSGGVCSIQGASMPTRPTLFSALGVAGAALGGLAAYDLLQRRHSVLRNYPVIGHLRYLLEGLRPELQQYFVERKWDGRPFDRDIRSFIY